MLRSLPCAAWLAAFSSCATTSWLCKHSRDSQLPPQLHLLPAAPAMATPHDVLLARPASPSCCPPLTRSATQSTATLSAFASMQSCHLCISPFSEIRGGVIPGDATKEACARPLLTLREVVGLHEGGMRIAAPYPSRRRVEQRYAGQTSGSICTHHF